MTDVPLKASFDGLEWVVECLGREASGATLPDALLLMADKIKAQDCIQRYEMAVGGDRLEMTYELDGSVTISSKRDRIGCTANGCDTLVAVMKYFGEAVPLYDADA